MLLVSNYFAVCNLDGTTSAHKAVKAIRVKLKMASSAANTDPVADV